MPSSAQVTLGLQQKHSYSPSTRSKIWSKYINAFKYMIDLPCEEDSMHRGFIKFRVLSWTPFSQNSYVPSSRLLHRGNPAGYKHGFLSLCLQCPQLLGISGKKQLGVVVCTWNHRKPRQQQFAASLGYVVKPLPPQINKGRHEGRERHVKEPPCPKSAFCCW